MQRDIRKLRTALAVFGGLSIAAVPAAAQDRDRSRGLVDEILVTAKQREESIQDVALSIQAFSENELDVFRIDDLRGLADFTPGLNYSAATGRGMPSILAIRGIAPNTGNIQLQGVSVFLDGVYAGGGSHALDLTQLQRIEVLRGPQATTFGRQTYAGAIDYITATPRVDSLTGNVKADYSSNAGAEKDNYQVSGLVQFPLLQDRVWMELSAMSKVYGELALSGSRGQPIGREETDSWGASLYFEPTDALSIRVRGMWGKERDSIPLIATTHPQEWEAFGVPTEQLSSGVIWPVGRLFAPTADMADCESDAGRPIDCGNDRDRFFFSTIADYELPSGIMASYRMGYGADDRWTNQDLYFRGNPDPFFGDAPYTAPPPAAPGAKFPFFFNATSSEYRNLSHELRLLSPEDQALRWRAGVFFYSESLSNFFVNNVNDNNPEGRSRGDERVRNLAMFGGIGYDFTDEWSIEAEARLQREENIFDACTVCVTAAGTPGSGFKENEDKESNTDILPRVTLKYTPNDTLMLYGLISQGTKAGRWNQTVATEFRYVEPEKLTNYELGWKSELVDGRVLFNGAVFFMDVTDQQFSAVTTNQQGNPITLFDNVGESESYGFELDARAAVTEQWSIAAGLAMAKHEFTSDTVPTAANLVRLFEGGTFKGLTSIGLPRWTGNVRSTYFFPLNADMDIQLDGSLTYQSKTYADAANLAEIKPITRVNLRAAVDAGWWEVAVFVRDLFDSDKPGSPAISATNSCLYRDRGDGTLFSPIQRCLAVGVDRGREVGASLRFRF